MPARGIVRASFRIRMKKRYLKLVRQALKSLRHPQLRHRPWWQAISGPFANRALWIPCRDTVASGMAIGFFFSMMPMIPQSIVAAILAMRVKANIPFAMAACFVSNPLTNVPIWVAQIRLGQWLIDVLSLPVPHFLAKAHTSLPGVGEMSVSNFIVGFVAMGVILSLCAFPLVHLFSAIMPQHLPVRRRRTWPPGKQPNAASSLGSQQNPGDEKPTKDVLPRSD
jgi:uncharacterized protein